MSSVRGRCTFPVDTELESHLQPQQLLSPHHPKGCQVPPLLLEGWQMPQATAEAILFL